MLQRGRKSAASLETPSMTGQSPRLTAPLSLNDGERTLFNKLIGACDSTHFRKSDLPLLTSFIQATLIAEAAAHDPDKIAVWEKSVKLQATLATRLRLSPQSRIDPKTVGRQQLFPGRKPWEDRQPWEKDDRE